MESKEVTKDEIYLCKNCHYPLSSSNCIKKVFQNYDDTILDNLLSKQNIDFSIYKYLFIFEEKSKSSFKDFCFGIDYNKNKIFCKNDNYIIGFIIQMNENNFIGIPLIVGFININEVEIKKMEFKAKKNQIPVISQYQYTVLAKLKQLRYYVKQLTPTLKESMKLVQLEKRNIYACEDKFDKYKLNLALNKYNEIEKERKMQDKNIQIKKDNNDNDNEENNIDID